MKKQETILAGYISTIRLRVINKISGFLNPIRIIIVNKQDSIKIKLNRLPKFNFVTSKRPVQIIKEISAIKIVENDFYANAKLKINLNTKLEIVNFNNIFKQQSNLLKEVIEENKEEIRQRAMNQFNQQNRRGNV